LHAMLDVDTLDTALSLLGPQTDSKVLKDYGWLVSMIKTVLDTSEVRTIRDGRTEKAVVSGYFSREITRKRNLLLEEITRAKSFRHVIGRGVGGILKLLHENNSSNDDLNRTPEGWEECDASDDGTGRQRPVKSGRRMFLGRTRGHTRKHTPSQDLAVERRVRAHVTSAGQELNIGAHQ
jgi:hypothetical protein